MKVNEQEPFANGANPKIEQLDKYKNSDHGEFMTTNHGVKVNDDQNSLLGG